jgi:Mg-chelatase subunit ChlI
MTTTGDRIYPFTGIVGMADLKLALLLNAVSPAIGRLVPHPGAGRPDGDPARLPVGRCD